MVAPGASPHNYEPRPSQMTALSTARIYFAIGVPFEATWLEKIAAANPPIRVVHTDDGIRKIPMAAHRHGDEEHALGEGHGHGKEAHGHREDHEHGEEGTIHGGEAHAPGEAGDAEEDHHRHKGLDPHVWLSPPLVRIQARHILEALEAEDPANAEAYRRNHDAFAAELDALHADLDALFADHRGTAFMVYHPAWGYFADTYGLRQIPVELEGKAPKPARLQEVITHAREEGIRVIFVQPQFSRKSAETVAKAIGGQVVFADPLAADWSDNMRRQAERFRSALR